MKRLVLASGSPRRKEILDRFGVEYIIEKTDCDETVAPDMRPEDIVLALSGRKARKAFEDHKDDVVIGADTVIFIEKDTGFEILNKPKDRDDEERMLRDISGKIHFVYTGITVISSAGESSGYEVTKVNVRRIGEEEIKRYVATGEGSDKAGSYAIQGIGGVFSDNIEGSYSNVVGFPVMLLNRLLAEHGMRLL